MKIYFVEEFIEDCGQGVGGIYINEEEAKLRYLELKKLSPQLECKIFEAEVKEVPLAQTI